MPKEKNKMAINTEPFIHPTYLLSLGRDCKAAVEADKAFDTVAHTDCNCPVEADNPLVVVLDDSRGVPVVHASVARSEP